MIYYHNVQIKSNQSVLFTIICFIHSLLADNRIEELEALLLRQEEDRSKHLAEVHDLQEKINDLDIEVKGHESKLKHRNDQVADLQRELNEKVNQVVVLERDVRINLPFLHIFRENPFDISI